MAKVKIPKRVAGVKLPKRVRKRANKALKMAESPIVREAAVAALGLAGGAKAMKEANEGPGGKARHLDAEVLIEAIREAAMDGVRRFLEGLEEGLRNATAAAGDAAEAVGEKAAGEEAEDAKPTAAAG